MELPGRTTPPLASRSQIPFAVVGSGPVAEHHLGVLQRSGATPPVGLYTRHRERGQLLAERFRVRRFDSLDALLADEAVRAVDVCNANADHFPVAMAALAAGKHVLVEKPVALGVRDLEALAGQAAARRLVACAVFPKRFNRTTRLVGELLRGGLEGPLVAHSVVHMPRPDGYYRRPEKASRAVAGGGVLVYQAIHDLDLLIQLFGPVKDVLGFRENLYHPTEVEDTCLVLLRFTKGPLAYLEASTAPHFPPRVRHAIHGQRRFVVFDDRRVGVYSPRSGAAWPLLWTVSGLTARLRRVAARLGAGAPAGPGGYADVLADFRAGILNPSWTPLTSLDTTLETHRVIEAFYAGSAR